MIEILRKEILKRLHNTENTAISNIIFNCIQYSMKYNSNTDKFEMNLEDVRTEYFNENPDMRCGIIPTSSIAWEVSGGKFSVWITE